MNRLYPSVEADRPTDTPQWLNPAYTRCARAKITGWNGGDAHLLHAAARMASLHAVATWERRARQARGGTASHTWQHARTRLGLLLIKAGVALGGQPLALRMLRVSGKDVGNARLALVEATLTLVVSREGIGMGKPWPVTGDDTVVALAQSSRVRPAFVSRCWRAYNDRRIRRMAD